jgi:hypothetical protein
MTGKGNGPRQALPDGQSRCQTVPRRFWPLFRESRSGLPTSESRVPQSRFLKVLLLFPVKWFLPFLMTKADLRKLHTFTAFSAVCYIAAFF